MDNLITSLPAWGIFAIVLVKLAFDFAKSERLKRGDSIPPPRRGETTPEEIASVVRDETERAALIETLHRMSASQSSVADSIAQLARSEAKQTRLLERMNVRLESLDSKVMYLARQGGREPTGPFSVVRGGEEG